MVLSITVGFLSWGKSWLGRMGMSRTGVPSTASSNFWCYSVSVLDWEGGGWWSWWQHTVILGALSCFQSPFITISFNPIYSMRSSMPFPIYLRRLRFREVNPEITLLGRKQHWGRSWKAFLEIQLYLTSCFMFWSLQGQDSSHKRKWFLLQRPVSSLCIRRPRMPAFSFG